jgi:hypothetical protein
VEAEHGSQAISVHSFRSRYYSLARARLPSDATTQGDYSAKQLYVPLWKKKARPKQTRSQRGAQGNQKVIVACIARPQLRLLLAFDLHFVCLQQVLAFLRH